MKPKFIFWINVYFMISKFIYSIEIDLLNRSLFYELEFIYSIEIYFMKSKFIYLIKFIIFNRSLLMKSKFSFWIEINFSNLRLFFQSKFNFSESKLTYVLSNGNLFYRIKDYLVPQLRRRKSL